MIFFKKIIFEINTSKRSKNIKKLIFNKKKLIFLKIQLNPYFQTTPKCKSLDSLRVLGCGSSHFDLDACIFGS